MLLLFLSFLAIIVIIIVWLLKGKDLTSGQYPENIRNSALSCIKPEAEYEKAGDIDVKDKEVKINLIFNSSLELKKMSLIYTINHTSESEAYATEAVSHATFNKNLAASGYNVSKFSNKYARYDNKLIITLTANSSEIDEISAPYFMIALDDDYKVSARTLSDYRAMYESQGFVCLDTTEDNA